MRSSFSKGPHSSSYQDGIHPPLSQEFLKGLNLQSKPCTTSNSVPNPSSPAQLNPDMEYFVQKIAALARASSSAGDDTDSNANCVNDNRDTE